MFNFAEQTAGGLRPAPGTAKSRYRERKSDIIRNGIKNTGNNSPASGHSGIAAYREALCL